MKKYTKYVFLYNIYPIEYTHDEVNKNKILKAIPETIVLNEQRVMGKIINEGDGESIWIPEEKYLIGWTLANYEDLLDISFIGNLGYEVTSDCGVEWFNEHKDDEFYVKYLCE